MPDNDTTPDFEDSLRQLEEIVHKMEQGQLSLEESLGAFEQGIKLTRQCQTILKQAEQRVSKLMTKEGDIQLEDFEDNADHSPG
jgi:exodeoxyribonuclease VII small subunit